MKNTWSMYWRICVLQLLATSPLVPLFWVLWVLWEKFRSPDFILIKLTLVDFYMAAVLLFVKAFVPNGALSLVWGHRLTDHARFWQTAQRVLVGSHCLLGLVNLFVAYNAPVETWLNYKTWGPLLAFVAAAVFLAWTLRGTSRPSITKAASNDKEMAS